MSSGVDTHAPNGNPDAIPFAKKALELGKNKGLLPVRLADVADHWDQGGKDDTFIVFFTLPGGVWCEAAHGRIEYYKLMEAMMAAAVCTCPHPRPTRRARVASVTWHPIPCNG